ncbi:MAG: NfeD family protein [Microgenomates group bacterium]|jgi:membrane protein implicated in regulation of membrane protease activity
MWATWWVWIVGGFALGVLEVLVPGYVFLGFALGAVFTGILIGLGVLSASAPFLLLVFALASLGAWIVLNKTLGMQKGQVKVWDKDINE